MVHYAAEARALMTRLITWLTAVVGSLLVLTACGHSGHHEGAAADPATVRTADCHDWKELKPTQRRQIVTGMRAFFGGRVDLPGARGQVLPDQDAIALFDTYCRQPYADTFSLYRIYARAAAFTPPTEPAHPN
jgi:hypothetical protein